jgi:hypothetical protein
VASEELGDIDDDSHLVQLAQNAAHFDGIVDPRTMVGGPQKDADLKALEHPRSTSHAS